MALLPARQLPKGALAQLRDLGGQARYAKIPIVIFTARAQEGDEKLGLECGADAYLTKPFDPPTLLAKIQELLEK